MVKSLKTEECEISGKRAKLLSGASVLQVFGAANGAPGTRVTLAVHRHPPRLTSVDCQPWVDTEPVTELGERL